nr:transposase [Idiomarina xiamenensis]
MCAITLQPSYSVPLGARQNGITPSLLFKWKKLMQDGDMYAIQAGDEVVSAAEHKALQKKVKQLEQLLGRKTMKTEILKEALEIAPPKQLISRMSFLPANDSLSSLVVNTLGLLRSNLYQRIYGRNLSRSARYNKQEDAVLLPQIEALYDGRETNGYRPLLSTQMASCAQMIMASFE